MKPRRVYTPLAFIACQLDLSSGHTMGPRRFYTPLGIIACPPKVLQDPRVDF